MNFEIIDNIFQVIVFSLIVVADIVCWFLQKNRLYIILALAHSCFMMGTLYFVLYLVIRGKVPQFFYVSEISWIASYLFLHSYQIVGYKGQRMGDRCICCFSRTMRCYSCVSCFVCHLDRF